MEITYNIVNALKADGKFYTAGALARELGHDRNYGCHLGMRSTRDAAIDAFQRGWDGADRERR